LIVVATTVAGLLVTGCSSGAERAGGEMTTTSSVTRLDPVAAQQLVAALCTVDRYAREGDPVRARAHYYAEAHESLHVLMEDLARADPAAGKLVDGAHNQLETAFAYLTQDQDITVELDAFRSAVEEHTTALGIDSRCP
jgi:hypothetical protein